MRIGIYPGSFDPLTNGHLDIIQRARKIVDRLVIAIAKNSDKQSLLTVDERLEIIRESCNSVSEDLSIVAFDGLLIDYCKTNNISMIVRGLRSADDFNYENILASANRSMEPDIETVFLPSRNEYSFISSKVVREIAQHRGDVSALVPPFALSLLAAKFSS